MKNLKRKPFRTAGLIVIVAMVAGAVFSGGLLSISMNNGIQSMRQRLGADLMVVPVGYDERAEGILLKGEPTYFYLDRSIEEEIKKTEGVKEVTTQFFLTSLNQECCDIPVQFIGFDPDTDFLIKPWIAEVYSKDLSDGELIVGHDITPDEDNNLKFFGKKYKVAAILEETGTGLDQAVYANINTLKNLFYDAKASGLQFIDTIDPDASVSSILVNIEDGYSADDVTHNIRVKLDGIQVIKTRTMISGISDSLGEIVIFLYVFAALVVAATLVMLIIVFSIMAGERKKEFAVLRTLGATGNQVSGILSTEALILSLAGGIVGTGFTAAVLLLFSTYIGDRVRLPYLNPEAWVILLIALVSIIASLILGPLAASFTHYKIARREVFLTMREGE